MDEEVFLLESAYDVEQISSRFNELWKKVPEDSSSKIKPSCESFYSPVEFPVIAQIAFAEVTVELKGCRNEKLIFIPVVTYAYLSDFSELTAALPFWQK